MKKGIFAALALVFFNLASYAQCDVNALIPTLSGKVYIIDMKEAILYYINFHRRSIGLRNLRLNGVESKLALQHSIDMASGRTPFGHDGLNERAKAISKEVGKITMAAENVASGDMSAKEVVDGWLKSPGHKRNIETDFTLTGIGVAKNDKGVVFYTQIFSK
ncbi:MAG TPA: CAP domain-containing protein [Puia sp.]|nr:CAP domain-containing protein [Puia sp.]